MANSSVPMCCRGPRSLGEVIPDTHPATVAGMETERPVSFWLLHSDHLAVTYYG